MKPSKVFIILALLAGVNIYLGLPSNQEEVPANKSTNSETQDQPEPPTPTHPTENVAPPISTNKKEEPISFEYEIPEGTKTRKRKAQNPEDLMSFYSKNHEAIKQKCNRNHLWSCDILVYSAKVKTGEEDDIFPLLEYSCEEFNQSCESFKIALEGLEQAFYKVLEECQASGQPDCESQINPSKFKYRDSENYKTELNGKCENGSQVHCAILQAISAK